MTSPGAARRTVTTGDVGDALTGWVQGEGPPVLLLHGGPGLSFEILDSLADELGLDYEIAAYQQRGLTPSTESGPFDVATHVADVRRMLDALAWSKAFVVGHSWGGHLAVHVALAMPERLHGVLCVDPLGAVGDGGEAEFEAEMMRRTPESVRSRAQELDERSLRGEGTAEDVIEGLSLVWPAYFPSWDAAPPMPPIRASLPCYSETWTSIRAELPRLESALGDIQVPMGFVACTASPLPGSAALDSAARIPGAWVEMVDDAGHLPWLDVPGSVRRAFERLTAQVSRS